MSVLENYHISESFNLIKKPENNILKNFSQEEFRLIRQRIIECILATDMANHTKHLTQLRYKLEKFKHYQRKKLQFIAIR